MTSTPPPRYPLGRNGPHVPAIGFGLMGMSYPIYGAVPSKDDQFALLDRAVEIGATFWDTADLYGNSEEVLGEWFRRTGKRDEIFLATKFGHVKGRPDFAANSSAEYCKQACEASLKALGVDSIDLYYLHAANPETPIEETMRALAQLQAQGKIKHIGLSNVSSTTLRRAYKIAPVAAVQAEYSVTERGIEGRAGTDLLATCRELGVAVVCETPLARGLLSTAFVGGTVGGADMRAQALPRFQDAHRGHNAQAVAPFRVLADKKACSVSQLALAWLLKQGNDIFPIPGTKTIKYLEENCAAARIQLSDEDEAETRALAEQTQIVGGTVPDKFADHLFRDTKPEISPNNE